MINLYNKICPELLKIVKLSCVSNDNDCVVYGNNFRKLKEEISKLGKPFYEYPFISAIGVSLNQKQIVKFAKTSLVGFIAKQTKVTTQVNVAKEIMNVDKITNKNIGSDITVAVIDTGISPHIDFCIPQNRIIKFVDLVSHKDFPYDDNGHGTYVASILCGNGLAGAKKYSGISPKSKIISIKALDNSGETGAYKILEAMQWISDNHKKYNIRVVCMSFGANPLGRNDPLVVGAESLWNLGLVVVAAAGNSGPENYTIKAPGFSSKIITVGGFDDGRDQNDDYSFKNFKIASFSSRGPAGMFFKPDLVAPAVDITGAGFDEKSGNFYIKMSGTSVATPMIAGLCCLIISKYPHITPDQLKVRLLRSCRSLTRNKNEEGFGIPTIESFLI